MPLFSRYMQRDPIKDALQALADWHDDLKEKLVSERRASWVTALGKWVAALDVFAQQHGGRKNVPEAIEKINEAARGIDRARVAGSPGTMQAISDVALQHGHLALCWLIAGFGLGDKVTFRGL